MRLAPLFALAALVAPALHAQTAPDPNPPASYYPLAVGNRWEYRIDNPGPTPPGVATHFRRTIVADTLVGGNRWSVRRTQNFRYYFQQWESVNDFRSVVRFDPVAANVLLRTPAGETVAEFACRLDGPITGPPPTSPSSVGCLQYGSYSKRIEGTGVVMNYYYPFTGITFRSETGVVSESYEGGATAGLVYASVGNERTGQSVVGMPNVPDLTKPEAYYPLAVGNEWQYEDCVREGSPSCNISHQYVRRTVARDTVIAGARYFAEVERRYTTSGAPLGRSERLLRFRGATLVRREGGADVSISCPLNADFDTPAIACPGYFGGAPARVLAQGSPWSVPAGKVYIIANDYSEAYTAGVGLVRTAMWTSPFTLRYARIGGTVVFGSVLVGGEATAPPSSALALRASPNPTAGALRLTLTLPEAQTVTVEAFDALGRRVWQQTVALSAGPQTLAVDASAWAPGVYVVRATAGQASATARVVRR